MHFNDARIAREGAPTTVWFLLLPQSLILEWAGIAEALRIANQQLVRGGQPPRFVSRFIGPEAVAHASVGVAVAGIEPLPEALPPPSWLVLVGQPGDGFRPQDPGVRPAIQWLRRVVAGSPPTRLVTACTGSILAAHAGLLDSRRATTHHASLDALRTAAPSCEVVANRVFVIDGAVASSAGVTTAIDLALHLVADECGAAVAARVAQTMVVALRRGPQDPELSPFLDHRAHMHPALHRLQDAMSADPQADWTLARMAEAACVSPRHVARLFAAHASIAPLDYLRSLRLAVAQTALRSGRSVTAAADAAGFASDLQLRRAWRRRGLAGTPSSL